MQSNKVIFFWLFVGLFFLAMIGGVLFKPSSIRSQKESLAVQVKMVELLSSIEHSSELPFITYSMRALFEQVVDLMICADEELRSFPKLFAKEQEQYDALLKASSSNLQASFARIEKLPGAKEWLKECQKNAFYRLTLYEQKRKEGAGNEKIPH